MQSKWLRRMTAVLILVGAAAAFAATMSGSTDQDDASARILPVQTVRAQTVTQYAIHRTYTGTVMAARSTDLSWNRAGEVVTIQADQGDRVEAGALLATLKTSRLAAKRRELVAQRAAAQAVLDELNAGARPETIAAARAEVRNLEAQVKLQKLILERRETLVNKRAVSKADYDQALYGLDSVTASLDSATQKSVELEAGPRIEKKQAQRATVEQLDAAIEAVEADLEDSQLVAPFGGTITGRLLDEGAIVAPGQRVLRLLEDTQLEVWLGVPLAAANQLQPGARCTVTVDQRALPATVKAVVPELDTATRTRRVVMSLQYDAQAPVFPGEIARVELVSEVTTEPSFWLPTTALVKGSRGLWSCFVVIADTTSDDAAIEASRIEKRDVKVIHTGGERVLVRGMLQDGDAVVEEGAHRVVPGQMVRNLAAP